MNYNKDNPDFKFFFRKNYDISKIKEVILRLESEWKEDTSRQETFQVHRHTNSYILNKVSIDWTVNNPLQQVYKHDNTELWELTEPIVKELEEACDGKAGQVLYINLPAGKVIDPHKDGGDYLFYKIGRAHV